jgi:hypothetical protein
MKLNCKFNGVQSGIASGDASADEPSPKACKLSEAKFRIEGFVEHPHRSPHIYFIFI